jgi:hypothetical protein
MRTLEVERAELADRQAAKRLCRLPGAGKLRKVLKAGTAE